MLRSRNEMKKTLIEKCHDGEGIVTACHVLDQEDSKLGITFMHDDTLAPGTTIGYHPHDESEEVYFVVEGNGSMVLDGNEYDIGPGDVCVCSPGHSHGIVNSEDSIMRLIVVGVGK